MGNKPLIFISNDDGIESMGINVLVDVMKTMGKVVVVAPKYPQSAKSHSITISNLIRAYPYYGFGKDVTAYSVSGSPADCVKIGRVKVLQEYMSIQKEPDLLVSGINHGSNTGLAVLYSGTVAAAIEGTISGIPSIGISLCDTSNNPNFSHTKKYIKKIATEVLSNRLPKNVTLNVNIPKYDDNNPIKGIRVARQTKAGWVEKFDERTDPDNKKYYWMTGDFANYEDKNDNQNDEWVVNNNYVSVVPCMYDLTSYPAIEWIKDKYNL